MDLRGVSAGSIAEIARATRQPITYSRKRDISPEASRSIMARSFPDTVRPPREPISLFLSLARRAIWIARQALSLARRCDALAGTKRDDTYRVYTHVRVIIIIHTRVHANGHIICAYRHSTSSPEAVTLIAVFPNPRELLPSVGTRRACAHVTARTVRTDVRCTGLPRLVQRGGWGRAREREAEEDRGERDEESDDVSEKGSPLRGSSSPAN